VLLAACGRRCSAEVSAGGTGCGQETVDHYGSLCWEGPGAVWRDLKLRDFLERHLRCLWC